jgi:hypothetical protein
VDTGRTFCLVEGPDPEALEHVLRLAYGLTADEIFKITEGLMTLAAQRQFMIRFSGPPRRSVP